MQPARFEVERESDDPSRQLNELLRDKAAIIASIENDANFTLKDSDTTKSAIDVQKLLKEDTELTKKLLALKELKVISELIEEFNTNFELWELENCYYSLQNIRKMMSKLNTQAIPLQFWEALNMHIDGLHVNLVCQALNVMHQFWVLDNESITFKQIALVDETGIELDYTHFSQFFKSCFFPHDHFEPSLWFVSSMSLGDAKDNAIDQLSKAFNEFIRLQGVQDKMKGLLFSSNVSLIFNKDTLSISTKPVDLEETLGTYRAVVNFLSKVAPVEDAGKLLSKLGPILITEVVKYIKRNSAQLFAPNSKYTQPLKELNQSLVELSTTVGSLWVYSGNEIDNLLQDDSVVHNLMLDKLLQTQITKIRECFKNESWKETKRVKSKTKSTALPASPVKRSHTSEQNANQVDDEWAWEQDDGSLASGNINADEDGWGDEIDLSLEVKDTGPSPATDTLQVNDEDDDWQNEWDESASLKEDLDGMMKVTQIPAFFQGVLSDFELGCDKIGRDKITATVDYKRNLLLTSFMAMCMCKYDEWWLLYHDVEYIMSDYPNPRKIFRLHELNAHFLNVHMENIKKTAKALILQQLQNFTENDKSPNWGITIESLLPYIETVALPVISRLRDSHIMANFINFIYIDCLVNEVLSWRMISEKNSENLAEMINLVLAGTEIDSKLSNPNILQSREKLAVVGRVQTAHLTDIMDMFSNGDFYLFSTDEIVQWIVMLFADTGLRRECIDEIRTIREEQNHA